MAFKKKFKRGSIHTMHQYDLKESRIKPKVIKVRDEVQPKKIVTSKGELLLKKLFIKLGIKYEAEKEFATCINPATGYRLRYDFYLIDYNTLIEYDGAHHSKRLKGVTQDTFNGILERDKIKDDWAKDNDIKLIRIPHTEIGNLDNIIRSTLPL